MRWGKLGRDHGTPTEPIWIDCPSCNKRGCEHCDGIRGIKITGRPTAPPWAWSVLTVCERYRKGIPPVAGGSLDQTHWINEACDFVECERNIHMSEYGMMAMLYG